MKYKKIILLLITSLLGAINIYADCECDDGTTDYSVDCDGDGINDACDTTDCDPCEAGNPASGIMACCDSVEYDPNPTTWEPQTWNLQQLMTMYNAAKGALTTLGPCSDTGGGAPSVGAQIATFKKCCSDEIIDLEKYSGSVTWDLGSTTCDWPIVGVPYTASINITANAGFNASLSTSGEQTCEETDVCFSLSGSFSGGGGLSATVAAGVIRFSGTLQVGTTVALNFCSESGVGGDLCVATMDVVGTAELAFISKSVSYNLYTGGC
jgi:hypothetical protein